MGSLSDQVGNHPVLLSLLKAVYLQSSHLTTAQAAAKHQRQNGSITATLERLYVRRGEQIPTLIGRQPIPSRTPIRFAPSIWTGSFSESTSRPSDVV